MSKEKLRLDKTCLNCGHIVEMRFCSHCGQENIETTRSFYHLFINFFEDFTHYDSTFWLTIFDLFFRPAALTKAYLSGKRKMFLAPIRLFLFIIFVTFFLLTLFSKDTVPVTVPVTDTTSEPITKVESVVIPTIDSLHIEEKGIDGLTKVGLLSQQNNDTIKMILQQTKGIDRKEVTNFGYESVTALDSLQEHGEAVNKVSSTEYWFLKKWLTVKEENTNEQIMEKFSASFFTNLPKVLIMYLPLFAFILWLFHDKKRWFYFDHGIFTLHYFSFLLLLTLVLFFVDKFIPLFGESPTLNWIYFGLKSAGLFWMIYYFFPAHKRLYGQSNFKSFIRSCILIGINSIIISCLVVLFALYTYNNIH